MKLYIAWSWYQNGGAKIEGVYTTEEAACNNDNANMDVIKVDTDTELSNVNLNPFI